MKKIRRPWSITEGAEVGGGGGGGWDGMELWIIFFYFTIQAGNGTGA